MFCFSGPICSAVVSCTATVLSVKPLHKLLALHLVVSSEALLKSSASNTVSPPGGDVKVKPLTNVPLCPSVLVTTTDGQSGTLVNGFTFTSPPGGETVLLADDFNNASLDTTKWSANNLWSGFTDSTVAVQETTALQIGPLKQNIDGSHYNGIKSTSSFNFTGAY